MDWLGWLADPGRSTMKTVYSLFGYIYLQRDDKIKKNLFFSLDSYNSANAKSHLGLLNYILDN